MHTEPCVDTLDLPALRDVASEIERMQLAVDAAELHGALCGFLSAGGQAQREDWLRRLALGEDGQAAAPDGALDQLYLASQVQLEDPDLGFALLLPEEDAPVTERAEALLSWCRGFLGGFGLAGNARASLSPEAAEALDDLSKIAGSSLSYDDPDGDEAALEEIAEFVRVATLLLHGDCVGAPRARQRLH